MTDLNNFFIKFLFIFLLFFLSSCGDPKPREMTKGHMDAVKKQCKNDPDKKLCGKEVRLKFKRDGHKYVSFEEFSKDEKNRMKALQLQLDEINDGLSRPTEIKPTKTSKVGVLGSGLMGHGIAYVSALAGMQVVMTDTSQENIDKGLNRIKTIINGACDKGLFSKKKGQGIISRINATVDYSELAGSDLIIEAVFEDRNLKAKVISNSEKFLDSNGILASNTSSIPITSLSNNTINAKKFIGIHFFSPVHKMKLVEIIKGEKTDPETLAKAFDYVIKINKVPIVVNDSRGFYTYRVFEKYTGEGMALLSEGNSAQAIESAGNKAGFPIGPLAVIDEISIGLIAHIRDQTRQDLKIEGKDLPTNPWDNVIDFMTKKVKRTGRASGGGFYEYPKGEKSFCGQSLIIISPSPMNY